MIALVHMPAHTLYMQAREWQWVMSVSDCHTGWRGDSEEVKAESGRPGRLRASEQDQH